MNSLLEQDKIKKLNILYIDDNIDPFIAEYLMEEYKYQDVEIEYGEILFNNDNNYETLLNKVTSIKKEADEKEVYSTSSLMDGYISDYMKNIWMLKATIAK